MAHSPPDAHENLGQPFLKRPQAQGSYAQVTLELARWIPSYQGIIRVKICGGWRFKPAQPVFVADPRMGVFVASPKEMVKVFSEEAVPSGSQSGSLLSLKIERHGAIF